MDSAWASPAWPGHKILVRVGDTPALTPAQIAQLLPDSTSDWRLFHLTRPFAPLALLQLVIDRMDRHRQFSAEAILLSPHRLAPEDCAAALDRVGTDPWCLDVVTDPETGHLARLMIGAGYAGHHLFVQFFRALQAADSQPLTQVLDQMARYLKPAAAPDPDGAAGSTVSGTGTGTGTGQTGKRRAGATR